jgi:uncharacterized repeat protein (TIGR03803 family)
VVLDPAGNIYGTAYGGNVGAGVVYKLDTTGHETVLSNLLPTGVVSGGVILDSAGNLYGTISPESLGFFGPGGAVYKVDPLGNATALYSFTGGADGSFPNHGVIADVAGNLYGATQYGGVGVDDAGFGVVYEVDTTGHETVLYTFTGGADGANPYAGVALDSAGNLYGTTQYGGVAAGKSGSGVVYKVDTTGHETVLHTFTGGADGGGPYAGVALDSAGNLYGTTYYDGASGGGVVYKVDTSGNFTVLHSFAGYNDGCNPTAPVILDSSGNLYGTTLYCGGSGNGTVFGLDPAGNEAVLYSFTGGADGGRPLASVVFDATGRLYGTTYVGGASNGGTVFRISGGLTVQIISFGQLANQPYGTAPFTLSATASSGLTVSFNSQTTPVCTVSGATVTLVAGGTCEIQATQSGNATYAAATPVNQYFQVTPLSQTITFGSLPNQPYGTAPFTVSATASSGLAVSFGSLTTPVCTVSGSTVTLILGGTCTIQATQAGNADYTTAAPVNQSFQVTPLSQTITFGPLPNQPYGTAPFTVSATASSGLAVSFNSQTTPVCRVSGTTVTLVEGGTCTIQATQTGNADYTVAAPVSQSFQVTPLSQTITFGPLPNQPYGAPPFTVSATASSGLTVRFNSQTTKVCKVSGTTVTIVAGGTCTIQATQAGNADYTAATPVNQSFQVTPLSQTITFGGLSNQTFGTPPFTVTATASSGLKVSFNSQTVSVCKVSGTTVRLVTVGTCMIQATQAGNTDYTAAPPVEQSFQVEQANQTITFDTLPNQALGSPPFTVSATASSGLTVRFNSQTKPVCRVSGTTVTLVAVGTCTIQATQAGNANYAAASPVDQSFQVTQ